MRITFIVFDIDHAGGTERSVVTQANALAAAGQDVRIVSVVRDVGEAHYDVDPAVQVEALVDLTDPKRPRLADAEAVGLDPVDPLEEELATRLARMPSVLVPARWDPQFSALTDVACEQRLPQLDSDVVVTVTPGLLAMAVQLLPERTALVHQEHRASSERTVGLEPLLTFAPRADVVALLTPSMADWLADALGRTAPPTVVVPNPLPQGYKPRSTLDTKLIVAAGRFVTEKQFPKLISAFGEIADQLPDWRLRIVGTGPQRIDMIRLVRRLGLYDRVELPGQSADMASEWATASISALPSRSEGLPLVVQEAMAAGVPVAAFDTPSGSRAVIEHEVNGLLVGPGSTSGLASALLRLATDDDLRRRLGEAAARSSRQYAPEVIASRWLTIFDRAVQRRSGARRPVRQRLADLAEVTAQPRASVSEPRAATDTTPAEARALALGWAVQCAARTSQRWFVVPADGSHVTAVAVPMTDREAFLAELGGPEAPEILSLVDTAGHGWPERRGPIPTMAADLARARTGRVSLEPWPRIDGWPGLLSVGCRIDVEFWESAPDGTLLAPDLNDYTSRVPPGSPTVEAEIEGVRVRTLPLMSEPTVRSCTFPVDAVYTWVDGDDPVWNAARAARLEAVTGSTAHRKESSGRARFISRDELRYSMRSLHLFAPWIRTIHLVTAGQVPPWLIDHPQVRVVDHHEILPAEALPTFNSHAIESSLHRIPGLAEHFVYLNDDFLLGRPLQPQMFFTPAGQTSVFLSPHSVGPDDLPDAAPWLKAAWNNRRLLRETFGVVNTNSLVHAPYAHRRSVLEEIERRYPEELARTARSPFRGDDNVSLLSSFAQHYGLMTGTAVEGCAETTYVDVSSADVARRLRSLQARDNDFICLGDHHEHALKPTVLQEVLERFFEFYFPVPAPWEKQD